MREYFLSLYGDMYSRHREYGLGDDWRVTEFPDFFIDIGLAGELTSEGLTLPAKTYKKLIKKLSPQRYAGLERHGLAATESAGTILLSHPDYPGMFTGIKPMAIAAKQQSTTGKFNFYECEFRQLFKKFSPSFDDILSKMGDGLRDYIQTLDAHCKLYKMKRDTGWNIKYLYNKHPVLRIVTLSSTVSACLYTIGDDGLQDAYFQALASEGAEVQAFVLDHTTACHNCTPGGCFRSRSEITLLDRPYRCGCGLLFPINARHLPIIKRLIDLRVQTIQR